MVGSVGQEIEASGFGDADFASFRERLVRETAHLRELFASGGLSAKGPVIGFELEAWLIDRNYFPAPHNQSFLERLGDANVVPELSRFNIEVNGLPRALAGGGLGLLEEELAATWGRCVANAHEDVDTVVAIGTLPTLRESDLSPDSMTPSNRYAALNRELLRLRGGEAVRMDIDSAAPGGDHLQTTHLDVMLEAATTSLQLHLQVPIDRLSATFNASMVLSAPLIAISANSPFLFGRALWHETRIPVFEQALEQSGDGKLHRVTFGNSYLGEDPSAIFGENLESYPVLLPMAQEAPTERMACLRMHNGTLWRWNRPLVGFDEDGTPHLRLEQRSIAAGPSLIDMMANAAFFYGAVHKLAESEPKPEQAVPFEAARTNFYAAARQGLDADVTWLDGRRVPVREVLAGLVYLAREGLAEQGVGEALIDRYIDVIELRLASGRNGASWQLAHHAKHRDLFRLTADYLEHQRSGMPVHEWPV